MLRAAHERLTDVIIGLHEAVQGAPELIDRLYECANNIGTAITANEEYINSIPNHIQSFTAEPVNVLDKIKSELFMPLNSGQTRWTLRPEFLPESGDYTSVMSYLDALEAPGNIPPKDDSDNESDGKEANPELESQLKAAQAVQRELTKYLDRERAANDEYRAQIRLLEAQVVELTKFFCTLARNQSSGSMLYSGMRSYSIFDAMTCL